MNKQNKKILLIDGYHMLYKGYYGSLKRKKQSLNRDGLLINSIYVFVANFVKLVKSKNYHTIIVALDVGKSCWRKDLYPQYKEKRKETPEELIPQMEILRSFLSSAKIPWYEKEANEGDDVLGTIARIATKLKYDVEIISNDKDIYQLISKNVTVASQKSKKDKNEVIGVEQVIETMGVEPLQIPDLKSLMGDVSDNIIKVKGLHKHVAISLLKQYGTVENILENVDKLNDKTKEKIIAAKDQIIMNKKITTIKTDLDLGWINFRPLKINYIGLMGFLKKQKMFSFINMIEEEYKLQLEWRKKKYEILNIVKEENNKKTKE
ncbi:5'-3' exonuclease [Spiroplasma endosymbiont of Crioceris asparagi]|uniref:5'-3' exonuclease n=1 Tax=Spiroplasma endosymbiont of Crioceris asparagi TaxID=3066286 RepID=UPI0030D0241E